MMRAGGRIVILWLVLAATCASASAAEGEKEPYELVRTLRSVHDQIVQGSASAHAFQRTLLAHIAEHMVRMDRAVWQEPRNVRAALVYVLSGGDPRVLKYLLTLGPLPGVEERLLKGTIAYGEGRNGEAAELLAPINARSLDPSIAGHVALVQSILITRKDRARAVALLDDARLLAPGTIVEEAALRREILLVAATGGFDKFEALSSQYLRRFPRSVYASSFRVQFAMHLAHQKDVEDSAQLSRLEDALESVAVADRQEVYLTIARESIRQGKIDVARFAANKAASLTGGDAGARARADVYAGAILVVTDDFDRGLKSLQGAERAKLTGEDAELLDAALQVAQEVRREPPVGDAPPPPPKPGALDRSAQLAKSEVARQAREVIAEVDRFLSEVNR